MAASDSIKELEAYQRGYRDACNQYNTKLECLRMAQGLNPKDAGDLIRKAAGINRWLTRDETPNNDD